MRQRSKRFRCGGRGRWKQVPLAAGRLYIGFAGSDGVHIGRSQHELLRIRIPLSLWGSLGQLPVLAEVAA